MKVAINTILSLIGASIVHLILIETEAKLTLLEFILMAVSCFFFLNLIDCIRREANV